MKERRDLKNDNSTTHIIPTPSPLLAINFSLAFNIKASYPFFVSSQAIATAQNRQKW